MANKEVKTVAEEVASEAKTITLKQYATDNKVNPGTLASFKYEGIAKPSLLEDKTEESWAKAFEAQANKIY